MNAKTGIIAAVIISGALFLVAGIVIGQKMSKDYYEGLEDARSTALAELSKKYDEPSTQTVTLRPNETQF